MVEQDLVVECPHPAVLLAGNRHVVFACVAEEDLVAGVFGVHGEVGAMVRPISALSQAPLPTAPVPERTQ